MAVRDIQEGFSIVVACKDAAARLPQTILHLSALESDQRFKFEVIIASNGSTDATVFEANKLCSHYLSSISYKVLDLPDPSKSDAIYQAVRCSSFSYVLLCDDDNWLGKSYLIHAFNSLANKSIGIIGGKSENIENVELPYWFYKFKDNFAVGHQVKNDEIESSNVDFLWGAGMVIRRSIFDFLFQINYKFLCGRNTFKSYLNGEDYELCILAKLMGYECWYESKLVLKHAIDFSRLNWNAMRKLLIRNKVPNIYLDSFKYVNECLVAKKKVNAEIFYKSQIKYYRDEYFKYFFKKVLGEILGKTEGYTYDLWFSCCRECLAELKFLKHSFPEMIDSMISTHKFMDEWRSVNDLEHAY